MPCLTGTMHRQGSQGILDGASNASLDNEFGTHKDDDVVAQILEKGEVIMTEVCIDASEVFLRSKGC
jgi:ribosome maturation protein Sdo1